MKSFLADLARPEYTPRPRLAWLRVLGQLAATWLLFGAPVLLWAWAGPDVGDGDTLEPAVLPWGRALALYYSALALAGALVLARSAWLTFRSGQSPHPGAWLPTRRRIVRGPLAHLAGVFRALYAAGLALALVWVWGKLQLAALLFGIGTYQAPAAGQACAGVSHATIAGPERFCTQPPGG